MLRNQAKRQAGFYVCASCQRQHQQDLARLRNAGRLHSHDCPSLSRAFVSTGLAISRRPESRSPRHGAPFASEEAFSKGRRLDVRCYAMWGRFGSNAVPGQSNSAWSAALKNSQTPVAESAGPSPSAAWGGGLAAGDKILPATGTSSWGGKLSGGVPPARPTHGGGISSGGANAGQVPPARPSPSTGFGQLHASWGSNGPNPSGSPPGANSRNPAFGSGIKPVGSSGTSGITGLSLTDLRQAAQSRETPAPKVHQQAVPSSLSSSRSQSSSSDTTRQLSNESLLDSTSSKPPGRPPPAGTDFPQLRRKETRDDLFESMSPFNLPRRETSNSWSSGVPGLGSTLEISQERERSTPRSPKRTPDQLRRRDRFHDWGAPSSLGSTAPPDSAETISSRPPPTATRFDNVGARGPKLPESSVSWSRLEFEPMSQPSNPQSGPMLSSSGDPFKSLVESSNLQKKEIRRSKQSDGDTPKNDASTPGESGPLVPRENYLEPPQPDERSETSVSRNMDRQGRVRHPDIKRGRGRDFDRNTGYRGQNRDFDESSSRRGRGDKLKKTHNRRQREDDDEYDEDFDYEQAMAIREQRIRAREEKRAAKEALAPKTILLPEYITVSDLADALRVKPRQFLNDLEQLGFENILHDSMMTGETAALVAAEYGFEPTVDTGDGRDLKPRPPPEDVSTVPPRPPIVTIMGHVDHGKTTMLDWLRKSSVAAQEHGGITQHIGAFSVKLKSGKLITFLDTPGHAAFLSMRQRGANVTDIVVLVVAVDDSVKPQTVEAIKHAQNAKVPMIVAINKIDIDDDPKRIEHVKSDLATNGVEIEDFGGDVQVVAVSGVTGRGMDDLEESILTLSEILDMRAEPDGMAEGWVLEASVKSDGRAATILVKRGTLRVGDLIVAGNTYTRIRTMRNEAGAEVKAAEPGTPVEIYGSWKQPPMAGDMVLQAPDESRAQSAVDYRQEVADRAEAAAQKAQKERADRDEAERKALEKMVMEEQRENGDKDAAAIEPEETGPKIFNIIVKGDVMGSVEAVANAVQEIGNNEVRTRILRSSPGQITESDIDHMATAQGCIINFNTVVPGLILRKAGDAGVKILDHNIIYEVVDAVKKQLSELLPPLTSQRVLAEAEVLQVFPINIIKRVYKNIAGVKVKNGMVTRGGLYRVMRNGEKIHEGKLEALKQKQKDVSEMRKGTECGMMFEDYDDFQPGDAIQLYEEVQEKRHL